MTVMSVHAWISDGAAKQLAQEQLTEELKEQVSLLLEQRGQLQAAHQQELNIIHDWMDKVAVPREKILRNAGQDAATWYGTDLDGCYIHATLGKDGWNVRCALKACTVPPSPGIDYLLDPLTGKILSRQVDDEDLP